MINVYLNSDLRLTQPTSITEITQFNFYELIVDVDIPSNRLLIANIVRPDGLKTAPLYLSHLGGTTWKGELRPFHTNIIPGTSDKGTLIISFTAKEVEGEEIVSIKSSPLIRFVVHRSLEPMEGFIPLAVEDEFGLRFLEIEGDMSLIQSILDYKMNLDGTNSNVDTLTFEDKEDGTKKWSMYVEDGAWKFEIEGEV